MKKSTIALTILASVTAIATGGAWFTGSQIEQKYPALLEKANHSLKNLAVYGIHNAQIKEVKVTKGFFSSEVTYSFAAELNGKTYLFNGNDQVFHGPLPLNRLTKGNLVPVLLSAESHVSPQDESLKAAFANRNAIDGTTNVSYSGEMDSESIIHPIKFTDGDTQLETSEIHFSGDLSGFGKQKLRVEQLKFISPNQQGLLEIADLNYEADFKKDATFSNITGIGPYSATAKNIKYLTEQQQLINITDAKFKGDSRVKAERLTGEGDFYTQLAWTVNDKTADFGKVHLDLAMDIDAKGLNDFYQFINKLETQDPEEIKQIQAASEAMFTNGLTLKLADLSLENAKGKNSLVTTIDLAKFKTADLAQAKTISENFKIFKPSHLNLTLDLAATEEAIKQWVTIAPEAQSGNPEEQAKKAIEDLITSAKSSELAVVSEQEIKVNVEIKENKMFLNGKEVPEEQLQMMMFMIMRGGK